MSRYSGKMYRGASREARALKRVQANARNKRSLPTRRAAFRRLTQAVEASK